LVFDRIEETDELLMPIALHVAARSPCRRGHSSPLTAW
jgi:hypothetical protein